MKRKEVLGCALTLALAGGCYAPMRTMTPAEGSGVRVSVARGLCQPSRPPTTEVLGEPGHLSAALEVENRSDRPLALQLERAQLVSDGSAHSPFSLHGHEIIEPHSHRQLSLTVDGEELRCNQPLTVVFGDSLSVDGQPLEVSPLRFWPSS